MIICDTHADTLFSRVVSPDSIHDLSLSRLQKGGVSLQTLALFIGHDGRQEAVAPLVSAMLKEFEIMKSQGFVQADDPSEARDGETRVMLSIEGCEAFESGIHSIAQFRDLGVRMAAITWNHDNLLGTPACKNDTEGLKPYGFQALKEMERLGIAADVSHLNIAGFYDILNHGTKAPLASHSCCRALCDHPRNLTDQQLKDLFRAGGYVGVNFYPNFLSKEGHCTIDEVVRHIDHMMQMGGEGKVGFGSDFDGIEHKPEGLKNPEDFPALIERLRDFGYSQSTIESIAGLALLDYYKRLKG